MRTAVHAGVVPSCGWCSISPEPQVRGTIAFPSDFCYYLTEQNAQPIRLIKITPSTRYHSTGMFSYTSTLLWCNLLRILSSIEEKCLDVAVFAGKVFQNHESHTSGKYCCTV